MRNDKSATGEFKINLPPDVVAEMRRGNAGNAPLARCTWIFSPACSAA